VSVTIPMEGSKHLPDDGLSTTKRDEDLPTIQEECPSCGNDMACVIVPCPTKLARGSFFRRACSVSVRVLVSCLQVLSNHAAAVSRRRADYLLHMHDLRLEVEAGFVAA
jgi:hypothetical protein